MSHKFDDDCQCNCDEVMKGFIGPEWDTPTSGHRTWHSLDNGETWDEGDAPAGADALTVRNVRRPRSVSDPKNRLRWKA